MILNEILRRRREDLERTRTRVPEEELRRLPVYLEERRGFLSALRAPGRRIVAEMKKASPSRGVLRPNFDCVALASECAASGAAALSVLTEERYFGGREEYLTATRHAVRLPLLRKDFIFHPYQLSESRALGADAILLILAALDDAQFRDLLGGARALALDALVEVHNEVELERALAAGVELVGVNNRDLQTFATSLAVTERLAEQIPAGVTVVGESGIESRADIVRLERCGVRAFLIGEALMRAPRPGAMLRDLMRR